MLEQLYRDQFAHYVDIADRTKENYEPNYVREGTGAESLSVAFNPQKDSFKDITQRTSKTTFTSYQLSSSISGKRLFKGDPMYDYANNLRRRAIAGETTLIEIDTTTKGVAGAYDAVKYDILITVNEWLGENATISYDFDYSNPQVGTASIADGKITFTPEVITTTK